MSIVVQKYGGSSLADADAIRSVARRIARSSEGEDQVVAVVSAMGDTTDRLIELAERVAGRPDTRELDALLATGELQSCTLVAMALHSLGCGAVSLSGAQAGIRTDSRHRGARISVVEPERITRELRSGKTVIVAGFQGITDDLDVTTLERGGSDTTAVAVAAGLGASRCEIYTDVDGIYTANPRIVPEARRLDEIGFEEMLELASYGAKFPPQAIELALSQASPMVKIEVEVTSVEDAQLAAEAGAHVIMLDNMDIEQMRKAVEVIDSRAAVEASGGINMQSVRAVASTGVDLISVGGLTHSVHALDIGMYLEFP